MINKNIILLLIIQLSCAHKKKFTTQLNQKSEASVAVDANCEHDAEALRCVSFVDNYDGDTIKVQIQGLPDIFGHNIAVRLVGIDSPEMKSKDPCEKEKAREARDLINQILHRAGRVDLVRPERDKYFRILADVQADGLSLSQILREKKLAVPYDGGAKARTDWCKD